MINKDALAQLKQAKAQGAIPASLKRATNGETIITFLYNPEVIDTEFKANYSTLQVGGALNVRQYVGSAGTTYQFTDLLIDTYYEGLSYEEALRKLKGVSAQGELVKFSWGSFTTPSCVLTAVATSSTSFLSGEMAGGRMDLTLEEAPQQPAATQAPTSSPLPTNIAKLKQTPRQQSQTVSLIRRFLSENNLKLPVTLTNELEKQLVSQRARLGDFEAAWNELQREYRVDFGDGLNYRAIINRLPGQLRKVVERLERIS